MFIRSRNFSPQSIERFRALQRLSFGILEDAAANLAAGQTERDVANLLFQRYRDAGANAFFHLPVVLFGQRTALPGNWSIGNFFPKDYPLADGDSVILDAAPIFDGYLVDTSYSCCFGENIVHRKMMQNLAVFREEVCNAVNYGRSFKSIATDVASRMQSMGYDAVHTKHPGEVLGHRTVKTVNLPFKWRIKGFDGLSLSWFILKGKAANAGLSKYAPTWNTGKTSDHEPHDGLWLVEPHAGCGTVGAKWEELLVIEGGKAYWLDDDVPHVRQWRQIEQGTPYRSSADITG